MNFLSSLRRDQKEAVWLLQTGTFLEYFDLMLYIHMAVLLNELFFPKTDPHTASLLTAFAFCTTFVMRPFGALIFGWIGDRVGRKTTVVVTTLMMALSCVVMANLPTYESIGIAAAWAVTLCRMAQGMSSMGEIVGVEIYITETTQPPARYQAIALTTVSTGIGALVALAIATAVTAHGLNWRIAFWMGAMIALVGSVARTRLRETPDFVDMKRRIKKVISEAEDNGFEKAADRLKKTSQFWKGKINKKTMLAYFLIACGWPVSFYFSYVHCGNILKNSFGFTPEQIIHQNFIVSIFQLLGFISFAALCHRIHPLKLLKMRLGVFMIAALLCPPVLYVVNTSFSLLIIQSITMFFSMAGEPASSNFLIHFPIFKRFTTYSLLYAFSRALMHIVTAFGLVYLTEWFGYWGLLCILMPTIAGFYWGVHHFENLENTQEPLNSLGTRESQGVLQPDAA